MNTQMRVCGYVQLFQIELSKELPSTSSSFALLSALYLNGVLNIKL